MSSYYNGVTICNTTVTSTSLTSAASINSSGGSLYLNSSGNWSTYTGNYKLHVSGPDPTISTDHGEINLKELMFLMREIKERLLLLEEQMKNHEEYPALKSIYDQYKVVETLVKYDQ